MVRTRVRDVQSEDISFVTEFELNEFFDHVVVTGTDDDTVIQETFDVYFPGRGLIIQEGSITVTTGTNFVSVSGGDADLVEVIAISGSLQDQIDSAGVGSITASGVTISGAVILEGLGSVSLHPSGQTIIISGTDVSGGGAGNITDINAQTGAVTVTGTGDIESTTAGGVITLDFTEGTDVDSITVTGTSLFGDVTFSGISGVSLTASGQTVTISGLSAEELENLKAFGELFEENDAGTDIIITTADTFVQWTDANVGQVSTDLTVSGSTENDNLTILENGAGEYLISDCATFSKIVRLSFSVEQ